MPIIDDLYALKNEERAKSSARFFKTAPGQYGEGDKFLGITVPALRKVAAKNQDCTLNELGSLLESPWHEARLLALIILVNKYKKAKFHAEKQQIVDFYVNNIKYVNNWDLVDTSAPYILGGFIYEHPGYYGSLKSLAHSPELWKRRIAIVSTFYFIRHGSSKECFEISDILLNDEHDLIHKAVGWMLREVGKNSDEKQLVDYLASRYKSMPRTMLRYAIEKFDAETRAKYLKGKV